MVGLSLNKWRKTDCFIALGFLFVNKKPFHYYSSLSCRHIVKPSSTCCLFLKIWFYLFLCYSLLPLQTKPALLMSSKLRSVKGPWEDHIVPVTSSYCYLSPFAINPFCCFPLPWESLTHTTPPPSSSQAPQASASRRSPASRPGLSCVPTAVFSLHPKIPRERRGWCFCTSPFPAQGISKMISVNLSAFPEAREEAPQCLCGLWELMTHSGNCALWEDPQITIRNKTLSLSPISYREVFLQRALLRTFFST